MDVSCRRYVGRILLWYVGKILSVDGQITMFKSLAHCSWVQFVSLIANFKKRIPKFLMCVVRLPIGFLQSIGP